MWGVRRVWASAPPDLFAPVMATGIVSIAAMDEHYQVISAILGVLAGVAFVLLAIMVASRIHAVRSSLIRRTRDPDVALRSFTFVAACGVLAARAGDAHPALGAALGAAAALAWLGSIVAVLITTRRPDAAVRDRARGGWLLVCVGTQSLAITAADFSPDAAPTALLLLALLWWWLGLLGYVWVAGLVVRRVIRRAFKPADMTPDSWILMGALAIAALAGDRILHADPAAQGLAWLATLARAQTLVVWVVATAWIPVLISGELWRARRRPGAARRARTWWSAVFPLGMYSSATFAASRQLQLSGLRTVSLVFCWVGLAGWLMVAASLVYERVPRQSEPSAHR